MQCLSCSGCLKCSIVDLGVRMNCFCCVWLHDLLALWSWTNYLCILSPNFCIYKMASHLVLRLVWWLCQCLACLALPSCSLSIWHNHPWGVSLYTCGLTLRDFLGGSPPSSCLWDFWGKNDGLGNIPFSREAPVCVWRVTTVSPLWAGPGCVLAFCTSRPCVPRRIQRSWHKQNAQLGETAMFGKKELFLEIMFLICSSIFRKSEAFVLNQIYPSLDWRRVKKWSNWVAKCVLCFLALSEEALDGSKWIPPFGEALH